MKKKITYGRVLKKVTVWGGYISVAVLFWFIMSCENNPLKPVSDSNTTDTTVQLIREKCSICHTLDKVRDYGGKNWDEVVDDMREHGADLTDEEAAEITTYLEEGKSF